MAIRYIPRGNPDASRLASAADRIEWQGSPACPIGLRWAPLDDVTTDALRAEIARLTARIKDARADRRLSRWESTTRRWDAIARDLSELTAIRAEIARRR